MKSAAMLHESALKPLLDARALALLGARVVASTGSFVIVPYLVLLMTQRLGLSGLAASLLASVIFVGGRLFARPLGVCADRYPDLPLMPLCLLAGGGSVLVFAAEPSSITIAMAAAGCIGLSLSGTAFMVLLRAHIARAFPQQSLPALYSASSTMFNIGMFAGAAAGALLMDALGLKWLAIGSAALHAAACLLALAAGRVAAHRRIERATDIRPSTRDVPATALAPFVCASATLGYLTTSVNITLAVYSARVLGSGGYAAGFFSTQSIALAVFLPVIGLSIARMGVKRLYWMYFGGLLAAAAGFCAFSLAPTDHPRLAVAALAAFFCVSQCMSIPSADPLLTQLFGNRASGRMFGTTTSAAAIGGLLSCVVNGLAVDRLADAHLPWIWLVPGVLAMAALTCIAVIGQRLVAAPVSASGPGVSRVSGARVQA